MTRYDTLKSGYNPLNELYERDENGDVMRRDPIYPAMKQFLDKYVERLTIPEMIKWTANREEE